MKCAIWQCRDERYSNGVASPFCVAHRAEFEASGEGKNLRATSESDFRDRLWKEHCVAEATKKWETATPEQREEWKKGGFGR